jgi:hypothetical protein
MQCAGITLSAGDANNRAVEVQTVGPCPPSVTGLGAGLAGPIIVNSAGRLERKAAPISSDVVAGKCDADGWAYLSFGSVSATVDLEDSASVDGVLPVANGGTGSSVAGSAGNVLVSDGTKFIPGALDLENSDACIGELPPEHGGTGLSALAAGIADFLETGSGVNLAAALTSLIPIAAYAANPTVNGLRLTVTSGEPVPTIDASNASTIYLTPYSSGAIALFDGTNWVLRQTAEVSLSVSSTSAGVYDVFAYWTGSAVALELSTVWTSTTAQADALGSQDGVAVKSGAPTRRHVGTVWLTGTGQIQWTERRRGVWNRQNQVPLSVLVRDDTDSWSYTTTSYRVARGDANNCVQCVVGVPGWLDAVAFHSAQSGSGAIGIATGIGVNGTTNDAQLFSGAADTAKPSDLFAFYKGTPSVVGVRTLNWLEYGAANASFFGDNGTPVRRRTGLVAGYMG